MSHVTCLVSHVTCRMSHVLCHMLIFFDKVGKLREVIPEKKLLPFGHCPKVALTPPPPLVLDTFGVNFF